MPDLKTSIIIDLAGNLVRQSRRFGRSMQGMSNKGVRSFSRLRAAASKDLSRIGNRYTAFLTGAAGVGAVRMVAQLEERFTRLGIQAQKSDAEINALKDTIFATAQADDINIDPSKITAAIEAIVEKTGDLDFARENIRNIGVAIQATGASGGAIGEILAEFQKLGITAPAEVLKALDTLNLQGKQGAFTLQNLAALGPRVITAYASLGRTGTSSLRELGAALQVIRMGTGSSEQAATAFEAVIRTISDKKKIDQLKELANIDVFNNAGEFRAINEIMAEIIQKSGGDKVKLSQIFDAEAMRAFNSAAAEFKRTGHLESLEKFIKLQGDGTTTMLDSARAAKTLNASYEGLTAGLKEFAEKKLTGPLQTAVKGLRFINSKEGTNVIGGTIATILAAFGNEKAQAALDSEFKHKIQLEITGNQNVKVGSMKSSSPNADIEVDTGATMVGQ